MSKKQTSTPAGAEERTATPSRATARNDRKPMWVLKQSLLKENTLQLYIYGDVEGDGYDWWTGARIESDTSAEHFRQELAKYPEVDEIEIFINSYGGEVFEGTAIYNQLRRHQAHKTVYVDGFACSIASVIAMAGDEVVMPRNTMMMIHNMWMGCWGNAAQLRKAADDLDTINAAGRQAYLQKAGDKLSEEKLVELMDAETWLTAEQCIELGLADRFADEDADLEAAAGILQRMNADLQQQVERNKGIAAQLREMAAGTADGPGDPSTAALRASAQDDKKRGAQDDKKRGAQDDKGDGRATEGVGPYGADGKAAEDTEPRKPRLMEFLAGVQF